MSPRRTACTTGSRSSRCSTISVPMNPARACRRRPSGPRTGPWPRASREKRSTSRWRLRPRKRCSATWPRRFPGSGTTASIRPASSSTSPRRRAPSTTSSWPSPKSAPWPVPAETWLSAAGHPRQIDSRVVSSGSGCNMKSLTAVVVIAALSTCGTAYAQRADKPLPVGGGFLAQMDMEFGGDKILTVDFEDGDSQDIRAGQGLALDVGGWFRPSENVPFEIAGTVGYKFVMTAAENADINLSRTVVKLNATYWFRNTWFATAGLTHHVSPKLDGDGFFEDITFE